MSENAIDSENISKPAPDPAKRKRKPGKNAKPPKNAKKPTGKPKADRANRKAEVIAMMKRAKGATLLEIMKATGWHRRHRFVIVPRIISWKTGVHNQVDAVFRSPYLRLY